MRCVEGEGGGGEREWGGVCMRYVEEQGVRVCVRGVEGGHTLASC